METINKIDKVLNVINRRLSELCGILLFIVMILLIVNVVSREVGYAIPGVSNLSVLILISVVYLGLSTTEQYKQHAAVEILLYRFNKRNRKIMDIVINLIKLITVLIFLYAAFGNFLFSFESQESFADVVHIPIWPSKLALLAGLFFFTLQILLNLIKVFVDPQYMDHEAKDLTENL